MRKPKLTSWLLIAVAVVILDQASKLWALSALANQDMSVCWGLNFALTQNAGAVFGILAKSSGWQRWFFTGFALVMMLVILIWQKKLSSEDFLESISLAFVLGGGIGNVIDRVRLGYVVDFIDVYYDKWHWYTFNIADVFICIGATLLLLIAIFEEKKPHRLFD